MDRHSSAGASSPTKEKERERKDSKAERPSSPPSRLDALRAEDDDGEENKTLSNLLESTTISTLIPKQELIQVSKNDTVQAALELMAKNNIVSVPVRDDSTGRFVGMFDTLDLVALSLSVASDKDPESHFFSTPVGKVINFSTVDVFAPMSGQLSLYHLVETFTRGIHRIPVFDANGTKVVSVASQSLVVKFLADHMGQLGRAGSKSLKDLHLGVKKVITVEESAKAIEGYKLMDANKLESIAVVSADGRLVGQLSASDLRGLAKDLFSSLDKRISDFINKAKKVSTCSPDAKLKDVIKQLASGSLHRLWIVDKENHPIGVVSLGDVMKALMLSLNVTPKRKKTRSVDFSKLKGFKMNLPPEDPRPNSPPKPASP